MRFPLGTLVMMLGALGAVSCGSSDPASTTTDSGTAGDTAKTDTPTGTCEEPGTVYVKEASGKAQDTTGKALTKKAISVCGTVCYPGTTGDDGSFVVPIGDCIKAEIFSVSVHGRPESASLYQRAPAPTGTGKDARIVLTDIFSVPTLPTDGPTIPFDDKTNLIATKTTIESGGLKLTFEAGTEVSLDIEDVELAALGKKLRVVKVESKDYPPFAKGADILALYAANPFDAAFAKQKVTVTMPAPTGLAAGAKVEFVGLGKLVVIGTGKVSSDGTTVSTDPGQGLSYLTWVGVRAAK